MPKKAKKFIEKKNSVTFQVVHRSQQDPLVADSDAPQRVLVPLQELPKGNKEKSDRLEEQQKFGIFFDDDYNYLQHLRDAKNTTEWIPIDAEQETPKEAKLKLPSSVFASNVEEEVGLLNKAAPSGLRLDLDPDVVAAMDEDFDFDDSENELEDDFMELANASDKDEMSDVCEYSEEYESDDYSDEARDEITSLNGSQRSFRDEETKSRFTDYSMSSSVISRNSQLTLLDDRFEHMYSGYDDNEIGALDCEEIEGDISNASDILKEYANEFMKQKERKRLEHDAMLYRIQEQGSDDENDADLVTMRLPEKEKWDCESILSTYSNIYNHPKLITEPKNSKIKIDSKTGIPKDVLHANKLTAKALQMLNEEHQTDKVEPNSDLYTELLSSLSIRKNSETHDEKIERKHKLKLYRRERREEKKLNAKAFKKESIRQAKVAINVKNNVQQNKIV